MEIHIVPTYLYRLSFYQLWQFDAWQFSVRLVIKTIRPFLQSDFTQGLDEVGNHCLVSKMSHFPLDQLKISWLPPPLNLLYFHLCLG